MLRRRMCVLILKKFSYRTTVRSGRLILQVQHGTLIAGDAECASFIHPTVLSTGLWSHAEILIGQSDLCLFPNLSACGSGREEDLEKILWSFQPKRCLSQRGEVQTSNANLHHSADSVAFVLAMCHLMWFFSVILQRGEFVWVFLLIFVMWWVCCSRLLLHAASSSFQNPLRRCCVSQLRRRCSILPAYLF